MNAVNEKKYFIELLASIPFVILTFLSLKVSNNIYYLFFSIFLWIFFILLSSTREFTRVIDIKYIFLWIFYIYILVFSFNTEGINSIKLIFTYCINLMPIVMFDFYFRGIHPKARKWIINSLFLIFNLLIIYLSIINLYYLDKNPMIARYLTSYNPSTAIGEFGRDLPKAIGGGFNFVYGLIFIPPICIYILCNLKRNKKIKLVCSISCVFILYVIYRMNFATAFLLSVCFCIYTIISRFVKPIHIFFIIILGGIIIYMLFPYLDVFFNSLANIFPEKTILNERLNQIAEIFIGSNNESSIRYRLLNIEKSINTFYNHILIGKSYTVGFDFRGEAEFIGQHNEWLDILARYGVIGGGSLVSFIVLSLKDLRYTFKRTPFARLVNITIIILIILGFLNPILGTTVLLIVYIYVPCCIEIFMNREVSR